MAHENDWNFNVDAWSSYVPTFKDISSRKAWLDAQYGIINGHPPPDPPNSTDTSKTPPQDEGFFAKVDSFFIGSRSLDTPQQASTKPPPILPIGDIERRSGLLILGKSGFGKSSLMVNLALEDVKSGHGLFFLDPHGEAIDDLLKRGCQDEREAWRPAESTVSGEDQTGQEAVCG